jgi:hypothetical protein
MAREAGADEVSIQEAVQIGYKVRKGAASRFEKETESLLSET